MIVTLTVNPSLDRTVELDRGLLRGEVQRVTRSVEEPGGKGVNVTRALTASGAASVAVLPGRADDPLVVALASAGVPVVTVPIVARLRSNITITEPDGVTTKLNELGPVLTQAEQQALVAAVVAQSAPRGSCSPARSRRRCPPTSTSAWCARCAPQASPHASRSTRRARPSRRSSTRANPSTS